MGKYIHKCEMCGQEFYDYCQVTRFCNRSCYDEYRAKNGKLKEIICPVCNNKFKQIYSKQTFCSIECRAKSTSNKIECACDYCGKTFFRVPSEVNKHRNHYCSDECKKKAMWWSDNDTELLKENFNKISYREMTNIFSSPKTIDEIKRRAIYIGLTSGKEWSDKETKILVENYSSRPMSDVVNLLPSRSKDSILDKAKLLGLKSYFYLNRIYTEEDDEYLKNNYLSQTNDELAKALNRNANGIAQHLCVLKLYRPNDRSGYGGISEYIRGRLIPWIRQIKQDNNFTCAITGVRTKIIIHHIRGFNLILDEAVKQINFPIHDSIGDYTNEQLDELFTTFYNLQESYNSYICITESVHRHFHSLYGYGDNTENQWNEFINTYYKN